MISIPNLDPSNNSVRYIKAKICIYLSVNKILDINDFIYEFEGYSPLSILIALAQLTKGFNKDTIKIHASNLLLELHSFD